MAVSAPEFAGEGRRRRASDDIPLHERLPGWKRWSEICDCRVDGSADLRSRVELMAVYFGAELVRIPPFCVGPPFEVISRKSLQD